MTVPLARTKADREEGHALEEGDREGKRMDSSRKDETGENKEDTHGRAGRGS